jgi:zinc protease
VRPLAQAVYGRNKANPAIVRRVRPQEPNLIAAQRVHLEDARAGTAVLLRFIQVPSYSTAALGQAEGLELLTRIIGGDDSSRLYRKLVAERLASTAGTDYTSSGLDGGRMAFVIVPLSQVPLDKVEAVLDATLAEIREKGVTQEELDRAKSALEAKQVFESDNQMTLARRYGEGLALGRSIQDIDAVASRIRAATLEDIKKVAQEFLTLPRSVTGVLTPAAVTENAATASQANKQ